LFSGVDRWVVVEWCVFLCFIVIIIIERQINQAGIKQMFVKFVALMLRGDFFNQRN
jgi:hypothetical protein